MKILEYRDKPLFYGLNHNRLLGYDLIADASWNVTGDNGIPTGWTVETYPEQNILVLDN